jgi:hypothetical protein
MGAPNPFRPTFGTTPPLLVGRSGLVQAFVDGLEEGPGAAGRAMLLRGARGVGKTVLLNEVEREARERGWLVLSETASDHLVSDLVGDRLPTLLAEHGRRRRTTRMTGVTAPLGIGGATWSTTDREHPQETLRSAVERLLAARSKRRTGLLLTVDELDARFLADLSEVGVLLQHAFREERELAFVGAGLSANLEAVLKAPGLTFLQRASTHTLEAIAAVDVVEGLRVPIEVGGRSITAEALATCAAATSGYAFMLQLVGYETWRQQPARKRITVEDADAGVASARRRLGQLVLEPTLRDLSGTDKAFLVAMAEDDGPSLVGDVADRMGVDANYASQYRRRLLAAQVIRPVGYGVVDFSLPFLREYVREHADGLREDRARWSRARQRRDKGQERAEGRRN